MHGVRAKLLEQLHVFDAICNVHQSNCRHIETKIRWNDFPLSPAISGPSSQINTLLWSDFYVFARRYSSSNFKEIVFAVFEIGLQ